MQLFSKIISYLFHPLLMPTYGFILLLNSDFLYISNLLDEATKWMLIAITFGFTFLMPLINTLILLRLKRVKTLEMNDSKERALPYLSTVIYYLALFYLYNNAGFSAYLSFLILAAGATIFIIYLVNFKFKISAHCAGIGGLCGVALSFIYIFDIDLVWLFSILLITAGIIASARLKLLAHTPAQVYSGFAIGFAIEFIFMMTI